jgi:acyl carrier protein
VSEAAPTTESVLEEITRELVATLGGSFEAADVRVDVDLFASAEPLVADVWLDSMDVVALVGVLEDRFGVDLAEVLSGDEPATLAVLARCIAGARA